MAKQGQHKHDVNDPRESSGHNNPKKSTEITTGTYKKPETYKKQAAQHEATNAVPQHQHNDWQPDHRVFTTHEADNAARADDPKERSGSDSNADRKSRGH